jgi:hypothetical protein
MVQKILHRLLRVTSSSVSSFRLSSSPRSLHQVCDYITIARLFRRKRLVVHTLFYFSFGHPLRRVKDLMVVLQVTQERNSVVDIVLYYQIATAVAAFYDVFVCAGLHQYMIRWWQLE